MLHHDFSYRDCLAASELITWRVEDIIGGSNQLDFTRPFLPETLARVGPLKFLSTAEKRILNQIRAYGYLKTFGLIEEFIVPFMMDRTRGALQGDTHRMRAMLQFVAEEAKHIHLFRAFCDQFDRVFRTPCAVIGPPEEIAMAILGHHPLAVATIILQMEWMTQAHYADSVTDGQDLDPVFTNMLKHHWREEAQHAKIDTLMVEAMVRDCDKDEIVMAMTDYIKIARYIDNSLIKQVQFDLNSIERAIGRRLGECEREIFVKVQQQAVRWTFIGSGLAHPRFLATLEAVSPSTRRKVAAITPAFS